MIKLFTKKRNKKGFTLIELIVVIAILGILAAIAIPRLSGSRDRANRSAILANLRTIESAGSIAEAEGKTITGIGAANDANTVMTLMGQNYLGAVPTGPAGVTYTYTPSGGAVVDFGSGKTATSVGFTAPNTQTATLSTLVEP